MGHSLLYTMFLLPSKGIKSSLHFNIAWLSNKSTYVSLPFKLGYFFILSRLVERMLKTNNLTNENKHMDRLLS